MERASFSTAFRSSEDRKFPASELSKPLTSSRGWESDVGEEYPQVLVFDFGHERSIEQMQVLVHPVKTPSRISVFLSNATVLEGAPFKRLGNLSFCHNRNNSFRVGELKCAAIKSTARFVKLVVGSAHENVLNLHQQVGIQGLSFLGPPAPGLPVNDHPHTRALDPEASAADEVLRDMLYDRSVIQRALQLRGLKDKAIASDDFESAHTLKLQIDSLVPLAARIQDCENRKRQATAEEDYQLAQLLKNEADDLRAEALGATQQERAVALKQAPSPTQHAPARPPQHGPSEVIPRAEATVVPFDEQPAFNPSHIQATQTPEAADEHAEAAKRATASAHHDAPTAVLDVSALSSRDRQVADHIEQLVREPQGHPEDVRQAIKEVPASSQIQEVLGLYMTCCLFSRRHVLREAACKLLGRKQHPFLDQSANDVVDVTFQYILSRNVGLADRINTVFAASCSLLSLGLADQLTGSVGPILARDREPLVAVLVSRLADSNDKVRREAVALLGQLACHPAVGTQRVLNAVTTGRHQMGVQPWLSRLDVATGTLSCEQEEALRVIDNPDFGLGKLMKSLVLPALQHAKASVRDRAVELVCFLKPLVGRSALMVHISTLKPTLRSMIEKRLEAEAPDVAVPPGDTRPHRRRQSPAATAAVDTPRSPERPPFVGTPSTATQSEVTEMVSPNPSWPRRTQPSPIAGECQFCGLADDSFSEHAELLQHFQSECPMLLSCPLCQLPVEIRDINDHLVDDCQHRERVSRCPKCRCAFRSDAIAAHVQADKCIAASPDTIECSLCHTRLPNIDAFWSAHILEPPYCSGNTRSVVD